MTFGLFSSVRKFFSSCYNFFAAFSGDVSRTAAWERISIRLPFHCFNHFMGCSTLQLEIRPSDMCPTKVAIKKSWCLGQQNHKLWYDLMGLQTVVVIEEIDFSLKVYCWREKSPIADFFYVAFSCGVKTFWCLFRSCLLYDQRVLNISSSAKKRFRSRKILFCWHRHRRIFTNETRRIIFVFRGGNDNKQKRKRK